MFGSVSAEQVQVDPAIGGIVEYILSRIAALSDVVGDSGRHDPGHSRHFRRGVADERESLGKIGDMSILSPDLTRPHATPENRGMSILSPDF